MVQLSHRKRHNEAVIVVDNISPLLLSSLTEEFIIN